MKGFGHTKRDKVLLSWSLHIDGYWRCVKPTAWSIWPLTSSAGGRGARAESVRVTQALERNDKNTTTSIKARQILHLQHTPVFGTGTARLSELHTQYNTLEKQMNWQKKVMYWLVFFMSTWRESSRDPFCFTKKTQILLPSKNDH